MNIKYKLHKGDLLEWFAGYSLSSPTMAAMNRRSKNPGVVNIRESGCRNS